MSDGEVHLNAQSINEGSGVKSIIARTLKHFYTHFRNWKRASYVPIKFHRKALVHCATNKVPLISLPIRIKNGRQGLVLSPKQSPLVCSFGQAKQAKEQCSKPKLLQTPQKLQSKPKPKSQTLSHELTQARHAHNPEESTVTPRRSRPVICQPLKS